MRIPFLSKKTEDIDTDPVCGMDVLKSNPLGGASRHGGVTYVFCGYHCKTEFDKDPKRYVKA